MFAEDGSLRDDTFAPEKAFIAFPAFTIAGEFRRNGANATMNGMLDRLSRFVIIMIRRLVIHEEDMIETACDHQARERAHPAEATLAFIFMQARMAEARWRIPADSHAAIIAIGDASP